MKTKLFFAFFFMCCTLSTFTNSAISSNISLVNTSSSDIKEEVLLAGRLETGMIKSIRITPFEVWKSSSSVDITYLSNLSNITIEIKDELGQTFYQSVVNPVSSGQLVVDIQGWAAGSYTITFSNANGGCIYGTFTI